MYLDRLRHCGVDASIRSIALFVGSGHPPNVDAALRVLETAARMPDVLFVLAGGHVDALPGIPNGENVVARGVVNRAELDELLSCCDVALNPMASGSGTNIKMIDYFAAGAPVVSTAIGARGLGGTPGAHYLETELANLDDAIRSAIRVPSEADHRARAARDLAESLDWASIGEEYAQLIVRTIETPWIFDPAM
jgi:glycosyltransferase involved in cell wall biosynthesis